MGLTRSGIICPATPAPGLRDGGDGDRPPRAGPFYRAYLLGRQLREIYRVGFDDAIVLLDGWLAWARRFRLAPFVKLAKTVTDQRAGIEAAIRHRLFNARIEQVNTQIRLITRRAFGFHPAHAAIALAMLALGGLCPSLPGR